MDYLKTRKCIEDVSYRDAIIIGIAQGFSILPGISRTGITTFSALLLGIKREDAAKYSLILAVPTIFGAVFLEFIRYGEYVASNAKIYIVAFILSFIFGLVSIKMFIEFLTRKKFKIFGIYCILVGFLSLLLYQSI